MKVRKFFQYLFLFLIFLFLIYPFVETKAAINCLLITANSSASDKRFCRKELNQLEKEYAALLKKQNVQRKNTGTLQGDVSYLNSQIKALNSKIKARSVAIAQIRASITEKNTKIETLSEKIYNQYNTLAQLIRNTNDFDNENLVHLLFSRDSLSDFYDDLESYNSIQEAIKKSVDQIKDTKDLTEKEKQELQERQNAENDAKYELEVSEKKVSRNEKEKKQLLSISKQKESEYKKLAAAKKVRADKIRTALFQLRDSKAIPFGTALEYAKMVEKRTGVRPAFLLAIITQETNLGANVGTCNRPSDPISKSWRNIMKPTRDIAPYIRITNALGIPQDGTPLSCPWGNGWGGAMGPSQFIPSTWELFVYKVATALGISGMPNPWNPQHAFMASGIYLSELGANKQTYSKERDAACRYYSGRSCSDPKVKNIFYGNGVMKKATSIQTNIDLLSS